MTNAKQRQERRRQVIDLSRRTRDMTERRNRAIKAMRTEGSSLREIAAAAELSHTAIAKICDR